MPLYRIPYLDPNTQSTGEARVEADSPEAALLVLRAKGLLPLQDPKEERQRRQAVLSPAVLAAFLRQLASLLSTGRINPPQALELLEENIPQRFRPRYRLAYAKVAQGEPLSEGLAATGLFPNLVVALVQVGEGTGKLDEVLRKLYDYYTKRASFIRKLRGALTYPAIVVLLAFAITWGLMVFVVPQFTGLLKEMDADLPLLTRAVSAVSAFLASPLGILGVLGGSALLVQGLRYIWATPHLRRSLEPYLLRAPLIGPILRYANLASFASTFALMHRSGIHTYETLDYIRRLMGLLLYAEALGGMRRVVATQGELLSRAMEDYPELFPRLFTIMVRIGEETGKLDEMLEHAAHSYEEEADSLLSSISSVVEPFLLILVGGMIGVIMLSVLLPYFAIAQRIGGGF